MGNFDAFGLANSESVVSQTKQKYVTGTKRGIHFLKTHTNQEPSL